MMVICCSLFKIKFLLLVTCSRKICKRGWFLFWERNWCSLLF